MIKVVSAPASRMEITGVIEPFRASIVDVSRESVVIQVTGESSKIEALIELLKPYGIKEVARTGTTAFARDNQQKPQTNKTISIV